MSLSNEQKPDEEDLVNSVIQGNTLAFGVIVRNTEGLVAQIVFRMLSNTEDRKDIIQEIYVKVFRNLSEFKFRSKLSTWIARIAFTTCVNYLEKEKRLPDSRPLEQDEEGEDPLGQLSPDAKYSEPEEHVFRRELSSILTVEMEKLPPLYRMIVVLYHQEDLSYMDIAQVTGLPSGTVKSYLFRARKKLKENILAQYKQEEL